YTDNAMKEGIGTNSTRIKRDAKLISISSVDLNTKANYQDFQRFQVIDVQMAADAEATLPALIEAVKSAIPNERKAAIGKRGEPDLGRFSVSIQSDGDLMYAPGVLWTAAKHKIPLLAVMHNNRGYHQEVMHVQRLSNFRNRVANLGGDMGPVGTRIENPDVEYHKLAE